MAKIIFFVISFVFGKIKLTSLLKIKVDEIQRGDITQKVIINDLNHQIKNQFQNHIFMYVNIKVKDKATKAINKIIGKNFFSFLKFMFFNFLYKIILL